MNEPPDFKATIFTCEPEPGKVTALIRLGVYSICQTADSEEEAIRLVTLQWNQNSLPGRVVGAARVIPMGQCVLHRAPFEPIYNEIHSRIIVTAASMDYDYTPMGPFTAMLRMFVGVGRSIYVYGCGRTISEAVENLNGNMDDEIRSLVRRPPPIVLLNESELGI